MIFTLFFLQSISIAYAFLNTTKMYDIKTVVNSYVSNTIDQHSLHATSPHYMNMIQQESHLTARYFQSVRYILHGFSITNATNNNEKVYPKLNFIQSIAYFYCGMNMSDVMSVPFDNIFIDESHLYMNSTIFPVQLVESYELIRSEICERIKLELYQSIVDLFEPHVYVHHSFFVRFIGSVAKFISSKTHRKSFSLQGIGNIYPFLAKFGEFELYKETVIHHMWEINNFALASKASGDGIRVEFDLCVNDIKYPKMFRYIARILNSTGNTSFIQKDHNTSDFWHYVEMYEFATGIAAVNHQVGNNTLEIINLMQLLYECWVPSESFITSAIMTDCMLIAFGIYESCEPFEDGTDGHEHVLNALKCIFAHHDLYCSKYGASYDHFSHMFSMLRDDVEESQIEDVFYPYLNEMMNDAQFVTIVNNNTDSEIDTYLQEILFKLMMYALEEHKDIEMIKKIASVFKPKINIYTDYCTFQGNLKYQLSALAMSWVDVLIQNECMYLIKYFQQRFKHQVMVTQVPTRL